MIGTKSSYLHYHLSLIHTDHINNNTDKYPVIRNITYYVAALQYYIQFSVAIYPQT